MKLYIKYFLLAFISVNSLSAQVLTTTENNGNLILEDIPPIPQNLKDDLRKFQNVRSGSFRGFDASGKQLYISTRFGNVSQLHLVKSPNGARNQITYFEEPIGSIRKQPNGNLIAFTMDSGGSENAQIFKLNPTDGSYDLLTDGESRNGGPLWDKSGTKIAYRSNKRNGASNDVWMMSVDDPKSAEIILKSPDGTSWGPIDWSEDGSKVLIQNYISITDSKVYMVNIASKEKTLILGDLGVKSVNSGLSFDKESKGIFYVTDKFGEFNNLAYKNLETEKVQVITSDIKWDVDGFTLSKDGNRAAFTVNENGFSTLYLMNAKTMKYKKVSSIPIGLVGGIQFNEKSNMLGLSINTYENPSDSYTLELMKNPLNHGKLTRWTDSEVGGLDTSSFISPELISYKSFDGLEVPAFVYAKESEEPLPVIIYIHGGPEGQSRPSFSSTFQLWIDQLGAAVITPNVRGSEGYGKTYLGLDNGFNREDSVKDIGALLDWIETQPQFDSSRIAVYGGSYGGYMVLASAVHYSDRLKAAIDIVGISNFVTFLTNTQDYRRDLRRVEYGDERDPAMRAFLEEISPNNNVEKISVPMFVAQGENDPRVPVTEAEQIVESLRNAGKTVWYMNALNEGHGYRKKENRDLYQQAVILFLEQHL
ncbi:MAG: alpha/beta fold hydrolase [Gammaproteobacteria bacterium]|tara:strand:- start:7033 stop:8976 length:1944 start_codon:yes stop_codon:yes gene_type:complete